MLNFPFGKIFLGDGGAYFSGYLIATLAVMLPVRNPEISPWISLLILGYPITETIVSIARRFLSDNGKIGSPDDGHLHHRIYFHWSGSLMNLFGKRFSQNSVTSIIVWVIPLPAIYFVTFTELNTPNALQALTLLVLIYGVMYWATKARAGGKIARLTRLGKMWQK